MAVKIFHHSVSGLKQMLVSDSTDQATCWSEIETAYNNEFYDPANPYSQAFVILPSGKCPMQLLTVSQYNVLRDAGIAEISDTEISAIADAYQAANP